MKTDVREGGHILSIGRMCHPFRAGGHVPQLPLEQLKALHFVDLNGKDLARAKEETIKLHKSVGYDGIVITNHFNMENLEVFQGTYHEQVSQWLEGYHLAYEAGQKNGLKVFFGLEVRLTVNDNDYLIYGLTPDFLLHHECLCLLSLEELSKLCHQEKALLIQAHPFRKGCTPADVRYLDGIEKLNRNPRHDNHNEQANALTIAYPELIGTAGSDFHQNEDLNGAPVYFETAIDTEEQLVEALKNRKILLRH